MEADELNVGSLREMIAVIHGFPNIHNAEVDCGTLQKLQEDLAEMISAWQAKQTEKQELNSDLQQQVALAERRLVSAKMEYSENSEAIERVREDLAHAQNMEKLKQEDVKDLEDCIEALEQQLLSIKTQKETFEKPDADEAFLKNELSLFLNVSSILPDLGDPKFSGTFVDKQKGVRTFKFSSADMSQFETCKAAWDMMR